MSKDKGWLIICFADLRRRVVKENSPYASFILQVLSQEVRQGWERRDIETPRADKSTQTGSWVSTKDFIACGVPQLYGWGRNRIGRREKWPKKGWDEGEKEGKSREEGEKEKLGVGRTELDRLRWGNQKVEIEEGEGEIGSESRERGDLLPCSFPLYMCWDLYYFSFHVNDISYHLKR